MTSGFPTPAWLVGCGNMAGAMVEGWRKAGVDLSGVTVIRPSGTPVENVRTVTTYPDERPRFVMLGFKPQKLAEIAPDLAPHLGPDTILVSILAGITAAMLRDYFPAARAVVRAMPNLPVAEVQGVTAIYSEDLSFDEFLATCGPLAGLGMTHWCETEQQLGVVGAVASAGIAYVARFADALGHTAEALGINASRARSIAIQTLVGTSDLAKTTGWSMEEIARRVASPKGTTEQGLAVLDAPDGLQSLVDRTLAAAIRRSSELAEELRRS